MTIIEHKRDALVISLFAGMFVMMFYDIQIMMEIMIEDLGLLDTKNPSNLVTLKFFFLVFKTGAVFLLAILFLRFKTVKK